MAARKKASKKPKSARGVNKFAAYVLFGIVALLFFGLFIIERPKQEPVIIEQEEVYDPVIKPETFTTDITNPYFTLRPGSYWVYAKDNEANEIQITGETKEVMGVTTLVYWDREWKNGVLVEDTRDYLAQDEVGNVWYFGEEVDNYIDGVLANHNGSWLAGENGALPGIWMKAEPRLGDEFRQEYYPGVAEDMGTIEGVDETVTTSLGTFEGCVKILDWTPLEPTAKEHKYYCPDAGNMVLINDLTDNETKELTDYFKAN